MKPLKLTMTAFGPYAGTQSIDFRNATDAGLFGIYGPTGAGKSSIFSAMSFALFGEGARHDQPTTSMRSDHAGPDALTEVAFIFELGSKRYLARRQPEQARPKKRGEGETVSRHQAWLFDVTDIALDEISESNSGTLMAEGRVSDVNARVRELLGYDLDQFRQIILLPQGQFEKFLAANSEARLEILRGLFDVSVYQAMTERLKQRSADARRAVEDGYRLQQQQLATAGYEGMEQLGSAIEAADLHRIEREGVAQAAEANRITADEALAAGEALAQRFREATIATAALDSLRQAQPHMAALEARRTLAEKARQLTDLDEAITNAQGAHESATQRHALATTHLSDVTAKRDAASRSFAGLKAASGEIDALKRRADELDRFAQMLGDASDLKEVADQAENGLELARDRAQAAEDEVERLSSAQDDLRQRLEFARTNENRRVRLVAERGTAQLALGQARDHQVATRALQQANAAQQQAERAAADARTRHADLEADAERHQAAFIAGQAQSLAVQLESGQPCPVCGSADHPAPAEGGAIAVQHLEAAWRDARTAVQAAATTLQSAISALSSATSLADERRARLATLGQDKGDAETLSEQLDQLDDAIAALGDPVDQAALSSEFNAFAQGLLAAREEQQAAARQLNAAEKHAAVSQRSYEDHIAGVPESSRDLDALAADQDMILTQIETRQNALDAAQTLLSESDSHCAAAVRDLANAAQRIEECAQDLASAQRAFTTRRDTLALTDQSYALAKPDIVQIASFTETLAAHKADLARAEGRQLDTQAAIAERVAPDLDTLRGTSAEARRIAGATQQDAAAAGEAKAALERLRDSVTAQTTELAKLEEETGPLRKLADAFAGQNLVRTTLEAYAVGAMFDQVLEAANLRFSPMSQGRYRLERDVQSVGGRSRRGLDIRVHDIQTGRSREVSTLSGGETFIAALALALGLSDIVEMSHGAIRLDTIFIDEGFGSLDSDGESGTLDQVLQVLQNIVGQQRSVGLISHVPLVQQAVPNGFTVLKGVAGSTIEERIL